MTLSEAMAKAAMHDRIRRAEKRLAYSFVVDDRGLVSVETDAYGTIAQWRVPRPSDFSATDWQIHRSTTTVEVIEP